MSEPIRPDFRLSMAAAFTTFTSLIGLARLVQPKAWFFECILLTLVVMAAGHLIRLALHGRGGLLNAVVLLGQAVAGVLVYVALTVPGVAPLGCIPGPAALRAIGTLFSAGGSAMQTAVPPAQPVPGLTAILCLVGLGLALLIDALAATFHRAVLTGLPVLATVLVPATRLPNGPGAWFAFSVATVGYLTLLNTEGQAKLQRWGQVNAAPTPQAAGKSDDHAAGGTHQPLAARITITSLVAALILPVFIPSFPNLLSSGPGSGAPGGGTYSLSSDVDLRNSLTSQTAVPLLSYTSTATDVPNEYLGVTDLNTFDGNSWTAGPAKPSPAPTPSGAAVPGLTLPGVAEAQVASKITVTGAFSFSSIPTPYATTSIAGVANMMTNPTNLGYTTDEPAGNQLGLVYQSTSTDVIPTSAQLQGSPSVNPATEAQFLQLPKDLPAEVLQVAQQVTAGDTTPYSKAMALQNYFLKNFTYSLTVPSGDGNSAIVRFLNNKLGFCQQFAATMATMARLLGIPSVVEIGFTPGTEQPDRSYQVTTHDAHAWPMLYFSGIGWVRFEPTPTIASSGRGSEPSWAPAPAVNTPSTGPAATATIGAAAPTTPASKCGSALHGRVVIQCGTGANKPAAAAPFASWGPFAGFPREFKRLFLTGGYALIIFKLALLAIFLAYCAPAYARISRRLKRRALVRKLNRLLARAAAQEAQGRAGGGSADDPSDEAVAAGARTGSRNRSLFAQATEAVWAELRENAGDLGYSWDDSDTPRQATARLTREARLDSPAGAAAGRITTLAEHAWYAPQTIPEPGQLQKLSKDLDLVRSGLAANAVRSRRLRTALLPDSSLAKLRARRDLAASGVYRVLHPRRSKR